MKKIVWVLIVCLTGFFVEAQPTAVLTDENVETELSAVFARARNAETAARISQQLQLVAPIQTNRNLYHSNHAIHITPFANTQASKELYVANNAADNSAASQRRWQIGLVMASETRTVPQTILELKGQIAAGHIALATLLDVTMLPNQTSGKTKKPGTKDANKKQRDSSRITANIYVLFPEGNQVATEKRTFQITNNSDKLVATVLDHLKAQEDKYYTALVFEAHGSGHALNTNNASSLSMERLAALTGSRKLRVDFLGLASCHMASMSAIHDLVKQGNIKYLAAASNSLYTPDTFYRFLRSFNKAPREVAISFVNSWKKELSLPNPKYPLTNNMSALDLSALKNALDEYLIWYDVVQNQEIVQSPEALVIKNKFRSLFGDFYEDWGSLSTKITQQRNYISDRLTQENPSLDVLIEAEKEFIKASDHLLAALRRATLANWCYSGPHHQTYTGQQPAGSGCIDSINTGAWQYWALTNHSADK